MPAKTHHALILALGLALSLTACGDGDNAAEGDAANPTPAENISEAEPEGVGGTSND